MISPGNLERIKSSVRNIPDFPKKGILFKDITTTLKQPQLLHLVVGDITKHFRDKGISKVVAIESRGFITGGAIAYKLGAGFIPVRKPGKLPSQTYSVSYDLEYGTDAVEIHKDALDSGDVVLLHDDLLATGGTALAVLNLLRKFDIRQVYASFIIELDFLKGRQKLETAHEIYSLIHF